MNLHNGVTLAFNCETSFAPLYSASASVDGRFGMKISQICRSRLAPYRYPSTKYPSSPESSSRVSGWNGDGTSRPSLSAASFATASGTTAMAMHSMINSLRAETKSDCVSTYHRSSIYGDFRPPSLPNPDPRARLTVRQSTQSSIGAAGRHPPAPPFSRRRRRRSAGSSVSVVPAPRKTFCVEDLMSGPRSSPSGLI